MEPIEPDADSVRFDWPVARLSPGVAPRALADHRVNGKSAVQLGGRTSAEP
jgi:hypothetical protein